MPLYIYRVYRHIWTCCWIITLMSKWISGCHIILLVCLSYMFPIRQAQKTLSLHQRLALGEYQPDHVEYVRRKDERSWDWCMVRCRVLSSQRQRSRYCFSIIHGYVATASTLHPNTVIHPDRSSCISWNFVVTPEVRQCFLFCFSVTQGHQLGTQAVDIDGDDGYKVYMTTTIMHRIDV